MEEKIKLTEAVIVEGKYDKIKLSNILDAFIIETNGFAIFKDKSKLSFIKKLAKERGIIILTDSDHAGFMIRNYISSGVPKEQIKNVYIPDIFGKEKRKSAPSKEGKLGVEGIDKDILIKAFEKAGITSSESAVRTEPVTKLDLYEAGLSGGENSSDKRSILLKELGLPQLLTTGGMLDIINSMMTRDEFLALCQRLFGG